VLEVLVGALDADHRDAELLAHLDSASVRPCVAAGAWILAMAKPSSNSM
jgi:hypothetical protein